MHRLLLTALLFLAVLPSTAAQGGARDAVIRLDRDVVAAILRGDLPFLERTYAEGYTYTGPDGRSRNRAEALADLRSGATKFDTIDADDRQVHLYGDTAVVTGREKLKGKDARGAFDSVVRYTAVYVMRDGRWQEVAFQATPVQQR
jgi:ketosteroid isomerase-like protein